MFDPTKPVRTRDGREARIIYVNVNILQSHCAIVALVKNQDGREWPVPYKEDGSLEEAAGQENDVDLINVPEKVEGWVLRAPNGTIRLDHFFRNKRAAEAILNHPVYKEFSLVHLTGEV